MQKLRTTIFILIIAGLLFSGYMSAVKLWSGTCAFNEPCPYFLGYPACWYGFGMYFVMFIVTLLSVLGRFRDVTAFVTDSLVSTLGLFFSGNFIIQEIAASNAVGGPLIFSTCVYGFIFYAAIFIVSLVASKKYCRPAA